MPSGRCRDSVEWSFDCSYIEFRHRHFASQLDRLPQLREYCDWFRYCVSKSFEVYCVWENGGRRRRRTSSGSTNKSASRPVRVIGADGAQLGIMPTDEAMRQARALDLDLVEVAPAERPPVCRIMDYGKFKYQQKKRQHKGHAHQVKIKEIRVRPKTGDHDIEVKVNKAREFLAAQGQGDRHGGVPRPGVGPRRRRPQGDRRHPGATGRRLEGRSPAGPSRPPHDLHAGAEVGNGQRLVVLLW